MKHHVRSSRMTPKKAHMGRPSLPEGKARRKVASQKYSEVELEEINKAAESADKSRVDFIRDAALKEARRINKKG